MNKKFWFVVVVWVALMIRATFAQGAIRGSLFGFTPDGSKLVVYSEGKIEIWQLPDLNLIKSFPVATASDLSTDNKFVYVAGVATSVNEHTGTVQVWDLDTGSLAREFNPCSGFAWCGPWTLSAHALRGAVVVSLVDNSALRYRTNSPSEASAYPDGVGIVIFDLNSGAQMNVFDVSDLITNAFLEVRNPKFSQDGISLAAQVPVNGVGNGIIVWDVSSGKRIAMVKTGSINYAISPDAQTLAVNEADYSKEQPRYEIHLISIKSGKVTTIPDFGSGQGIEFSSDGKLLAVAYSDGSIRLWDTVTGKNISTQTGTESYTFNGKIAFSPDGSLLIYGRFDRTITLAKVNTIPTETVTDPTELLPSVSGLSICVPSNANKSSGWGLISEAQAREQDFSPIECTSYIDEVYRRIERPCLGQPAHAYMWDDQFRENCPGFEIRSTPAVGDIAVWEGTASNPNGHVAYVTRVNDSETFSVSERNVIGPGLDSERDNLTVVPGISFIHMVCTITPIPIVAQGAPSYFLVPKAITPYVANVFVYYDTSKGVWNGVQFAQVTSSNNTTTFYVDGTWEAAHPGWTNFWWTYVHICSGPPK